MPDELDIEQPDQLFAYLRNTARLAPREDARLTILSGGVSNRAVLVQPGASPPFVIKQALAKLRVQVQWLSDPHRIHREALAMRRLASLLPQGSIPQLLFEDPTHLLLAMSAVPDPHENWKSMLLRGELHQDHIRQFAVLLARIHEGSHEAEFQEAFGDQRFFESLRLEPYYLFAASRVPQAADFLNQLVESTRQRRWCVVHGDYSPKNILVHRHQLVLLDHEVVHFGDPAFDLGFALTHLLSKAHHLPDHRGRFLDSARSFWRTYAANSPALLRRCEFEPRVVLHTLGCLLARVDGRSPLEYLSNQERDHQRRIVVQLMGTPPVAVPGLVKIFGDLL